MRVHVGLFLLAVGLAGVHAQVGRETGEAVLPVSTSMDAGSDTFVAGETTGICACGAGAATPECKAAVEEFCRDKANAKVCTQAATFRDINATQLARINSGKFLVDYLITECKYKFPKKTSGCDCIEDFESVKCNHAAWEACRRANTMCPAMHWGEEGGAASMESFGNFIQKKCAKGLAETEMTMKYEEMDEATWKSTTADGTGKSLSNITGLPGYMISNTAEQVTEDNQEPIKGGGRKMLEGWVQKQVTKMVVKYTMRSMMKKQSNVVKSLTGASANNGKGFFEKFEYYGVTARPFMSSPSINNGMTFGGPPAGAAAMAVSSAGAAGSGARMAAAGTNQFTAGQIAGIVIGCVVGALLLGLLPLLCCCCLLKKKKERKVVEEYHAPEGHVATTTGTTAVAKEVEHPDARYYKDHAGTTSTTRHADDDVHYTGTRDTADVVGTRATTSDYAREGVTGTGDYARDGVTSTGDYAREGVTSTGEVARDGTRSTGQVVKDAAKHAVDVAKHRK